MTVDGPPSWPDPRAPRLRFDAPGKVIIAGFVVVASVTAVLAAMWLPPMRRLVSTRAWPSAQGIVRSTTVFETKAQAPLYRSTHTLIATIEYTPAGGGPRVVENTPIFWNLQAAEATRLRPADGSTVTVRYDPSDPTQICLEAWTRRHTLRTALVAAGVLGCLALAPLVAWKAKTRQMR